MLLSFALVRAFASWHTLARTIGYIPVLINTTCRSIVPDTHAPALESIKVFRRSAINRRAFATASSLVPIKARITVFWKTVAKAAFWCRVPELANFAILLNANKSARSCVPFHAYRNDCSGVQRRTETLAALVIPIFAFCARRICRLSANALARLIVPHFISATAYCWFHTQAVASVFIPIVISWAHLWSALAPAFVFVEEFITSALMRVAQAHATCSVVIV